MNEDERKYIVVEQGMAHMAVCSRHWLITASVKQYCCHYYVECTCISVYMTTSSLLGSGNYDLAHDLRAITINERNTVQIFI